jgi:hypothetical protein
MNLACSACCVLFSELVLVPSLALTLPLRPAPPCRRQALQTEVAVVEDTISKKITEEKAAVVSAKAAGVSDRAGGLCGPGSTGAALPHATGLC